MNKNELYKAGLILFPDPQKKEERELVDLFRKHLPAKKGNLLEIGIGTGRFISFVHEAFPHFQCFGIDVVPDFVNQKIGSVSLSLQSAEKLVFKKNFFGAVFSIDALHHVPDREKALKEISRVTKLGGIVVFRDVRAHHHLDKFFYRVMDLSCLAYNSNLPKYFSPKEWETLLAKNGFELVEVKRYNKDLDWLVCKKVSERPLKKKN